MDDAAQRSAGTNVPSWEALAALYLRVADTLDWSASLADQHVERLRSSGQSDLVGRELARGKQARDAAKRARALASRAA